MKVYVVTKREDRIDSSNGYQDASTWFETLSVFDSREKAIDFMKVYAIRDSNNFINSNSGDYEFTKWKKGLGDALANRICYDYLSYHEGYDETLFTLIMDEKELK